MRRSFRSFGLLFLLAAHPAGANTNVEVDIGGVKIDVPASYGFYEISSFSTEWHETAQLFTPSTNRLLAVFVSEDDLGRIVKDEPPIFQRYMLLQTFRETEDKHISSANFQEMLLALAQNQGNFLNQRQEGMADDLIEGASKKISEEQGLLFRMELREVVPLGVFLKQSNALGFAGLVKYRVSVEGEDLDFVQAAGISFMLTRGKVLFAFVYSLYETQDDLEWVRAKSKEWVKLLLSSNNYGRFRSHPETQSEKGMDWGPILDRAIGGAIGAAAAFGLLALLIGLFRRTVNFFKKDI